MDFLRDSVWTGIGSIAGIVGLIVYVWVERRRIFPRAHRIPGSGLGPESGISSPVSGRLNDSTKSDQLEYADFKENLLYDTMAFRVLGGGLGLFLWLMLVAQLSDSNMLRAAGRTIFELLGTGSIVCPQWILAVVLLLNSIELWRKVRGLPHEFVLPGWNALSLLTKYVAAMVGALALIFLLTWVFPSTSPILEENWGFIEVSPIFPWA
jgi:hypothetical protein